MKLYLDEVIKQIAIYCRLTDSLEGYKLIQYILELNNSEDISKEKLNKLLSLHKFPDWGTISRITVKDIILK